MTWARYALIYVTLTLAAPIFLFLVGFCLPLGAAAPAPTPASLGLARAFRVPRGVPHHLAGFLLNLVVFHDEPILSGGVLQTIGLAIVAWCPRCGSCACRAAPPRLIGGGRPRLRDVRRGVPGAWRPLRAAAFTCDRPGALFYDFPPWAVAEPRAAGARARLDVARGPSAQYGGGRAR
jgi:hypothetical protein